ncbi:D-glucuronyl C5-epimerase family protein [Paraburkholderia sp. GAS334]|uniref:D-glucuronyl C5-epimerase family protein n=1 Tax=Paraburkholderia sp. GAS334 TaxID=3035131 RepID=UPI003D1C4817
MKNTSIKVRIATSNVLLAVLAAGILISGYENHRQSNDLRKRIAILQDQSTTLQGDVSKLQNLAQLANKPPAPVLTQSRDDEIYALQTVPTLSNVAIVDIQSKRIKASPFSIKYGTDPMKLQGFHVPAGWKPNSNAIESTLPYPWSTLYVQQFHQSFNADSFLYNIAALANFYKKTHDYAAIQPYVDYLVERLKEYSIVDGDASLVTYKFAYSFHDREMKPGWVSAYGNASILASLTYLASTAQRPELAALATKYFNGLHRFDSSHKLWVTSLDANQYLWFEEYPLDGEKKAGVLNGHIWTVFSLYYYAEACRTEDAVNMLNAGLTSLKRYLPAYRYPGRINRYDRYGDYTPDYFPKNTVDEERSLFAMTGDQVFRDMANAFMTDMPY